MSKWAGTLSTTEPYNHLGLLKVRQSNKNSEVFDFKIVQNGIPYDLTGYRVFFCTHFEPYVSIEKKVEILDAKKGEIRFVMDPDCMQKVGNQEGYFEIYKEDSFMDSTQNFTYSIQISIEKQLIDSESYIQRLEELLEKIDHVTEEIREELEKQLEEIKHFFDSNQEKFDNWFEAVQDILKSIDPGGVLLNEIVTARHSETYGQFDSVDARLENSDKLLMSILPTSEICAINHTLGGYPIVTVLQWIDGFGVNELGDENWAGSIPETVPCKVQYPDADTVIVMVPELFKMKNPEITKIDKTHYLVAEKENVLELTLGGI